MQKNRIKIFSIHQTRKIVKVDVWIYILIFHNFLKIIGTWLAIQDGQAYFLGIRGNGGSRQSICTARGQWSHSIILPFFLPQTIQHGSPVAYEKIIEVSRCN